MARVSMPRVALVTGSSSGIGAAVARRLGSDGFRVVVNSARSPAAGAAVAAELPGGEYVQADIADLDQARHLVAEAVRRCGRLDVLVNNAGVTQVIPHPDLEAATPEVWRRPFDVNVLGTWQVTVAAMPHLRETCDGCVVNVSSLAGVRPLGSSIPYAASKAAVNHMTRLLAAAVGPQVRVNAVAPGHIDTPWTAGWDEARALVEGTAPLHRSGQPEDIADTVAALVQAKYVTGDVWAVDGGFHLR
jgi:ketoreductase RED2